MSAEVYHRHDTDRQHTTNQPGKTALPVRSSSIKEEVKKKHHTAGWNFSCSAAPFNEQDLFWPAAPCARLLDADAQPLMKQSDRLLLA